MNVLGIDPGKNGGFAIVKNGKLTLVEPLPLIGGELSFKRMVKRFMAVSLTIDYILIEKVHAIMGAAAKTTFNFGCNYQMALDAAAMTDKPVDSVKPKVWQAEIFKGETYQKRADGKRDTKKMALLKAHRLFPKETFLASPRSTKPHDGMVDAALIAYYGSVLRIYDGS